MEELRGPNIQIVLHVKEGLGFGFLQSPFVVSGSLNGYLLETDPSVPCHAPAFDAELVWEADKRRLRNLRLQNVPIKIEVHTMGSQGRKNKVGYLLLSLLGAQPTPSNKMVNVKYAWHRLLGVRAEGKCCHSQLMLGLTIEDRAYTITPRNELKIFHSDEVTSYLPTSGNVTIRPQSLTLEDYLAESKKTATSPDLQPRLLVEEGLIQIGSAGSHLFLLRFLLGAAHNIDTLLPENGSESTDCLVTYSVFTHSIQTDRVAAMASDVKKSTLQFNQRSSLRLCTDLSSLSRYFSECPQVITRLCSGDQDIGICSTDLRKLVPTEDVDAFVESFCNSERAITVSERCFIVPCKGAVDPARRPFIDIEISLKYVGPRAEKNGQKLRSRCMEVDRDAASVAYIDSTTCRLPLSQRAGVLTVRSASHLGCAGDQGTGAAVEATLEMHKSRSCTEVDQDVASVAYIDSTTCRLPLSQRAGVLTVRSASHLGCAGDQGTGAAVEATLEMHKSRSCTEVDRDVASVAYIDSTTCRLPLSQRAGVLTARSASHLGCAGDQGTGAAVEATLEMHKSRSCTEVDRDVASVAYIDSTTCRLPLSQRAGVLTARSASHLGCAGDQGTGAAVEATLEMHKSRSCTEVDRDVASVAYIDSTTCRLPLSQRAGVLTARSASHLGCAGDQGTGAAVEATLEMHKSRSCTEVDRDVASVAYIDSTTCRLPLSQRAGVLTARSASHLGCAGDQGTGAAVEATLEMHKSRSCTEVDRDVASVAYIDSTTCRLPLSQRAGVLTARSASHLGCAGDQGTGAAVEATLEMHKSRSCTEVDRDVASVAYIDSTTCRLPLSQRAGVLTARSASHLGCAGDQGTGAAVEATLEMHKSRSCTEVDRDVASVAYIDSTTCRLPLSQRAGVLTARSASHLGCAGDQGTGAAVEATLEMHKSRSCTEVDRDVASVAYIDSTTCRLPLSQRAGVLTARSASHLGCAGDQGTGAAVEATLEMHKSRSCTEVDRDVASVTYTNITALNTSRYKNATGGAAIEGHNDVADMIKKMYESFTSTQERFLSCMVRPATSDIQVQCSVPPMDETPRVDNGNGDGNSRSQSPRRVDTHPQGSDNSQVQEKEKLNTLMSSEDRESLMKKCVVELEDWKDQQQQLFKLQLKQKEEYHLEMLSVEWSKRRSELEGRLSRGVEQCRNLAADLSRATEDFRLRGYRNTQREQKLLQAKQSLEQHYTGKFQELRDASQKMEEDMKHQGRLKDQRIEDLEVTVERLLKENETLKNNITKMEKDTQQKKSGLTKDQTASIIQEMRALEEKLEDAVQSKAFFKEQWGRAVRELHSFKLQERRRMLTRLQQQRRDLGDARPDNVAENGDAGMNHNEADFKKLTDDFYVNLLAETPVIAEGLDSASPFVNGLEASGASPFVNDGLGMPRKATNEKLNHLIEERDRLIQKENPNEDQLSQLNHEIRNILLSCGT